MSNVHNIIFYIKYLIKRTEWRKKYPWLELEPTKVITLEHGIISRKEACYIELILIGIMNVFIDPKNYLKN